MPLFLLAILTALLYGLWETTVRQRDPSEGDLAVPKAQNPTKIPIATLCAAIGVVGAIWLIPWSLSLSTGGRAGLLPGLLFLAILSLGVLSALRGTGIDE